MKPGEVTPSPWEWHYRTLSRLRDALARERDEHAAAFRQPIEQGGLDSADIAAPLREHDALLAELLAEDAELAEIEDALQRIRDGGYGICAVTGEPISPERLRALPWTRFCSEVIAELERAAGARR